MRKWLPIGLVVSAFFVLVCSRATAGGDVSPTEAARLVKETKNLQLIDVRTAAEYAGGHLAGAKLIPVQELADRLAEIDKKRPVLLYCRTDRRSGNALRLLEEHGFTGAKHIAGGINAWQAAGLPVTR